MGISDRNLLKQQARNALHNASYDPKKLILINTAAAAVLTLTTAALSFLIQDGISGTGGLSGIGLRSILSTASELLQNVSTFIIPFWYFGYLIAIMRILRREQVGPATLLDGFRLFFPALRLLLLRGLLYVAIAIFCLYPSVIIFSLTPFSGPLEALMAPMASLTSEAEILNYLDDATIAAIGNALIPVLLIYLALYLLVSVPVSYKLRLANYALIDDPKAGAVHALRTSSQLLRKNCIALFKLDLSFWPYYLIDTLLLALCYGDTWLAMLGITLPISSTAAYFLFYVLYLAGQVVFYWFAKNQVEATYAAAYDALRQEAAERANLSQNF